MIQQKILWFLVGFELFDVYALFGSAELHISSYNLVNYFLIHLRK